MVYVLSAEEIVQLIGIKSGALSEITEAILSQEGSVLDINKHTPVITQISDLSNEINSLAQELHAKTKGGENS